MPAVTTYAKTGNAYIDGVLGDLKWAVTEFTFSFPASGSYYGTGYGGGEPTNNFGALNTTQQAASRAVFNGFSSVANLTFAEITETSTQHADLRLAMSDTPGTAWAYLPNTAAEGGDAWFNKSSGYYSNPAKGNYAYTTFLHEVGHALGLEHAHEAYVMPLDRDSMEYSLMSYRSYVGAGLGGGYTNETWGYAQSLMMYDIAGLQQMYGADYTTNSGNTAYSWSPTTGEMSVNGTGQGAPGGNRIFLTVWDGGGTDTYDLSNYTTNLTIDLRPGEWTTTWSAQLAKLHYDGSKFAVGNIANALQYNTDARSLIENAKGGAGGDVIRGNDADNVLTGNGGNDTLDGGSGIDTAIFGGLWSQYQITSTTGSSLEVRDLRSGSPDGTDALANIEYLQFADMVISSGISTGFEHSGSWTGAGNGDEGWHVGDFNGDGRDDIFRCIWGSTGADMFLSSGSGFNDAGSWTGAGNGSEGWHIGDFNGDGRDDVFRFMPGSSGADMFLSTGSGFNDAGSWTGAGNGSEGWHIGDFNGDGRDDVFRYMPGSSGADMFLSSGSGFNGAGSWTGAGNGSTGWQVGDFNGDGKDDLVRAVEGTSSAEVFLSNGNAFVFAGQWSTDTSIPVGRQIGDFDGDGMDDLLQLSQNLSATEVLTSDGSGFDYTGNWSSVAGTSWQVGDYDGNGADDVFRYIQGMSGADVWLA